MKMPVRLYIRITVHQQYLDPNLWLVLQWDLHRKEEEQEKTVMLLALNTNKNNPAAIYHALYAKRCISRWPSVKITEEHYLLPKVIWQLAAWYNNCCCRKTRTRLKGLKPSIPALDHKARSLLLHPEWCCFPPLLSVVYLCFIASCSVLPRAVDMESSAQGRCCKCRGSHRDDIPLALSVTDTLLWCPYQHLQHLDVKVPCSSSVAVWQLCTTTFVPGFVCVRKCDGYACAKYGQSISFPASEPNNHLHHLPSLCIHEFLCLQACDWLLMNKWRHYQSANALTTK